jgi:hypothetical protein
MRKGKEGEWGVENTVSERDLGVHRTRVFSWKAIDVDG